MHICMYCTTAHTLPIQFFLNQYASATVLLPPTIHPTPKKYLLAISISHHFIILPHNLIIPGNILPL